MPRPCPEPRRWKACMDEQEGRLAPAVDLYWIPLGVGAHFVRLSGKLY